MSKTLFEKDFTTHSIRRSAARWAAPRCVHHNGAQPIELLTFLCYVLYVRHEVETFEQDGPAAVMARKGVKIMTVPLKEQKNGMFKDLNRDLHYKS